MPLLMLRVRCLLLMVQHATAYATYLLLMLLTSTAYADRLGISLRVCFIFLWLIPSENVSVVSPK